VCEIVGCHTDVYSGISLFLCTAVLSGQIGFYALATSASFLAGGFHQAHFLLTLAMEVKAAHS